MFLGQEPGSVQRGQTVQAKLTVGDSIEGALIPNGAFFSDTGGTWIFVVDSGGNPVRLVTVAGDVPAIGVTRKVDPDGPPNVARIKAARSVW